MRWSCKLCAVFKNFQQEKSAHRGGRIHENKMHGYPVMQVVQYSVPPCTWVPPPPPPGDSLRPPSNGTFIYTLRNIYIYHPLLLHAPAYKPIFSITKPTNTHTHTHTPTNSLHLIFDFHVFPFGFGEQPPITMAFGSTLFGVWFVVESHACWELCFSAFTF